LGSTKKEVFYGICVHLKKCVVGRFLDYKMVYQKPIMEQVHEYQHIVIETLGGRMKVDEAFQAATLIKKLLPFILEGLYTS
jgi:hypothetical protein